MAGIKNSDLRTLSLDDLNKRLGDARTELFNLRFQMATSQLDNTARVKIVKKNIARIQTEMRIREIKMTDGSVLHVLDSTKSNAGKKENKKEQDSPKKDKDNKSKKETKTEESSVKKDSKESN